MWFVVVISCLWGTCVMVVCYLIVGICLFGYIYSTLLSGWVCYWRVMGFDGIGFYDCYGLAGLSVCCLVVFVICLWVFSLLLVFVCG